KTALEVGGDENAEALGKAIGEIAWQVGSIATGVGGAAKGGVALAKAGIKVGTAELETMASLARIEKLAKAEAVRNRVVGAVADSQEGSASSKFGQLAKTEAELRDAQRVDGAKGPGQVIPDEINPPKFSRIEDLFGQTFESIPLSHLPNWKTGSLVNDGVLGEQLALQTLNEKTGLNFKPLQNSSNHGCDGCAVAINGDTITVVVMDAKSSVNGVSKAGTPHGDPRTRLEGWLSNRSIADSDPALRDALQAALDSGKAKVQGVTVKVGVPAPSKTGVAEFKVEPWTKK
ncbi:hypothetical protein, partial [Pseudomonas salomonii]